MTTTTYVIRSDDTASQSVDGELLVINFETSYFYGLNRTAAAAWSMLSSPCRVSTLVTHLARAFDADPAAVTVDVERLLEELVVAGLIAETDADEVPRAADAGEATGAWETPTLERHDRLDQLILSGE